MDLFNAVCVGRVLRRIRQGSPGPLPRAAMDARSGGMMRLYRMDNIQHPPRPVNRDQEGAALATISRLDGKAGEADSQATWIPPRALFVPPPLLSNHSVHMFVWASLNTLSYSVAACSRLRASRHVRLGYLDSEMGD